MVQIVLIGGTPGTGKTETANMLGAAFPGEVVHVGEIALQASLTKGFDAKRRTRILDPIKINHWLETYIKEKKGWVFLECHFVELVAFRPIEAVFILRTNPLVLQKRLNNRGWSNTKILENMQAEALGVCAGEALNTFGSNRVVEIDTTSSSLDETVKKIMELLRAPSKYTLALNNRYDWLMELAPEAIATVFP